MVNAENGKIQIIICIIIANNFVTTELYNNMEYFIGAQNLWCCTTCGEYLLSDPTNIQICCFDHMCTDLQETNVTERMNKVIEAVIGARENIIGAAPAAAYLNWNRIQSICRSLLFVLLLILFIWFTHSNVSHQSSYPSSPYEATGLTHWICLLTFGSMIDFYD